MLRVCSFSVMTVSPYCNVKYNRVKYRLILHDKRIQCTMKVKTWHENTVHKIKDMLKN